MIKAHEEAICRRYEDGTSSSAAVGFPKPAINSYPVEVINHRDHLIWRPKGGGATRFVNTHAHGIQPPGKEGVTEGEAEFGHEVASGKLGEAAQFVLLLGEHHTDRSWNKKKIAGFLKLLLLTLKLPPDLQLPSFKNNDSGEITNFYGGLIDTIRNPPVVWCPLETKFAGWGVTDWDRLNFAHFQETCGASFAEICGLVTQLEHDFSTAGRAITDATIDAAMAAAPATLKNMLSKLVPSHANSASHTDLAQLIGGLGGDCLDAVKKMGKPVLEILKISAITAGKRVLPAMQADIDGTVPHILAAYPPFARRMNAILAELEERKEIPHNFVRSTSSFSAGALVTCAEALCTSYGPYEIHAPFDARAPHALALDAFFHYRHDDVRYKPSWVIVANAPIIYKAGMPPITANPPSMYNILPQDGLTAAVGWGADKVRESVAKNPRLPIKKVYEPRGRHKMPCRLALAIMKRKITSCVAGLH